MQNERRFYVYTLTDPRTAEVFYVGKGTGGRDRSHVLNARRYCTQNPAKTRRILDIEAGGESVGVARIAAGLTEAQAFRLERQEIAKIGLANLTNITRGQNTDAERLLLEVDENLAILYRRLNDFLTGDAFTKQQWHLVFHFIRSLRGIRRKVEAELRGTV